MAPQNADQIMDNSLYETTFNGFVQFLINEKILRCNVYENLSLNQIKTIYNVHFKHNKALNKSDFILDFEDLKLFAITSRHLIVNPDEISFTAHNLKCFNSVREDLDQQMEEITNRMIKVRSKSTQNKTVRIELNPKKLIISSIIFPVAFNMKDITNVMNDYNPAILCAMNTNLAQNVELSEISIKGFRPFKQDVVNGIGGLVLYVNSMLEPSFITEMISQSSEEIWISLSYPDQIQAKEGLQTPTVCVGVVREFADRADDFYKELLVNVLKAVAQYQEVLLICQFSTDAVRSFASSLKLKHEIITLRGAPRQGYLIAHSGAIFSKVSSKLDVGSEPSRLIMETPRRKCTPCGEAFVSDEDFTEHKMTLRHRRNFFAHFFCEHRDQLVADKENISLSIEGPSSDILDFDYESGKYILKTRQGVPVTLKLAVSNGVPPEGGGKMEKKKCDEAGEKKGAASRKNDEKKATDPEEKNGLENQAAIEEKRDTKHSIVLKRMEMMTNDPGFEPNDRWSMFKSPTERDDKVKAGIWIKEGQAYPFEIKCMKPDIGQYRMPFFVQFNERLSDGRIDGQLYIIAREILLKVTNKDVEEIKPIAPYERPKPIAKRLHFRTLEPGLPLTTVSDGGGSRLVSNWKLDHFQIKPALRNILKKDNKNITLDRQTDEAMKAYKGCLESPLSHSNYYQRFETLLHCEELQMELDIRNYDLERVEMTISGPNLLRLQVLGLAENRPSVLKGDSIYAQVYARNDDPHPEPKEYQGYVHEVEDTSILIGFSPKLRNRFIPNMRFNIRFTFNRFPLRNMHRAVQFVAATPFMESMVFPSPPLEQLEGEVPPSRNAFFERFIEANEEQNLAVRSIVNGGLEGVPYIIFGPPGTGKTVTMTEAIKQVWKVKANSHILAAAPSNSAADLLAQKLIKHIPKTQIMRFYAPSRMEKSVPKDILDISNFHPSHADVSLGSLKNYRVIVVTLVTAGRVASAKFPQDHFSHVFVDEAGHATEPEAMIALANILAYPKGQVVLAGDPKQLGPVLRSPIALKHGLQLSLLERLMSQIQCYQRSPVTREFHSKTITKLLKNFRSHETLLSLPSKLFYENELKAAADPMVVNSLLNWDNLPDKSIPLVFHGVVGEDQREARSPSYFNPEEAALVVQYVQQLLDTGDKAVAKKVLPGEIGIISPYRRQVQKIKALLNSKFQNQKKYQNWKNITVGSTEEFQGQERRVIIISTVRSQPTLLQADYEHKLGFLNNPKRFNVAITRAKALLVVIGNPYLLVKDKWWKSLLKYVLDKGCYKGTPFDMANEGQEAEAGFVQLDDDHYRARFELDEIEKKFREMGLVDFNGSPSEGEEEVDFEAFENLDEISHQEFQQGLAWRNDM